jgi:hypothetical protein
MRPWLLAPALSVAGCLGQDYDVIEWDLVDVFYQNPMEQVDVLLVIDNSESMEHHQAELGRHFEAFLTYFIAADVDYHVAAITTDVFDRGAGVIQGEIIDARTRDAEETFAEIVAVGIEGSSREMGLEAAYLSFVDPTLSNENAGFLREDAALSIVFVSNEEDSSWHPVADYVNAFRNVKGQRQRDMFNASSLTAIDMDACDSEQAAASTEGTRYVDVALQTGGVVGDLCSDDLESVVVDLSLNTSRLWDVFFLSGIPNPQRIELTLDDDVVPCDDGRWGYELRQDEETGQERPAVVFERESLPPSGSQVVVRYYAGGGDPALFCTEQQGAR